MLVKTPGLQIVFGCERKICREPLDRRAPRPLRDGAGDNELRLVKPPRIDCMRRIVEDRWIGDCSCGSRRLLGRQARCRRDGEDHDLRWLAIRAARS